MQQTCPVCGSVDRTDVVTLPGMPVLINAQVRPDEAPSVPKGDIDLVVCHGCGHLYNRSFDETLLDYDASYENTLHYSPTFRSFAEGLADRLVADHGLAGGDVAELGSGPGHFLSMLCERGVGRGVGFDPSYDPDRLGAPEHPSVSISTELFPVDGSLPVSLAYSQHVLEHLTDPVAALVAQRRAVAARGGVVYSEVPNGGLMIERCALWDLIYEHLSYFVPTSFALAHARAGLVLHDVGTAFDDQFMWGQSERGDPAAIVDSDAVDAAVDAAVAFGAAARARVKEAREQVASMSSSALWGAGSKGATYLNLVADVAPVDAVIDINPRKHGWGVPGTSATISSPEVLREVRPEVVVVANPAYLDEVRERVVALGVSSDVVPLWS